MPVIRTGVLYKMACICHKPLLFHVIILWALAQYKERGGGGEEEREGQTAQVVCDGQCIGYGSPKLGVTTLQLMHIAVPLADSRHRLSLTMEGTHIT